MLLVLFRKWIDKQENSGLSSPLEETIEQKIGRIQAGDTELRNELIAAYRPFIAKTTSRCCKKYIDPNRDDEFSIAMQAFNEALNHYCPRTGGTFLGFAQTVIRRRLIDHIRKEERHNGNIPLSTFDVEDEDQHVLNPVETNMALSHFTKEKEAEARREEIVEFDQVLSDFGIKFSDLIKVSPKHADSRQLMLQIARILAHDRDLMQSLIEKKVLPIKSLLAKCNVSRKTLERNRKYLIAIALIHNGQYPHLQQYLAPLGEEVEDA